MIVPSTPKGSHCAVPDSPSHCHSSNPPSTPTSSAASQIPSDFCEFTNDEALVFENEPTNPVVDKEQYQLECLRSFLPEFAEEQLLLKGEESSVPGYNNFSAATVFLRFEGVTRLAALAEENTSTGTEVLSPTSLPFSKVASKRKYGNSADSVQFVLNLYMGKLVEHFIEMGGDVIGLEQSACLVLWRAPDEGKKALGMALSAASRAVIRAVRDMKDNLKARFGQVPLNVACGIGAGQVSAWLLGTKGRSVISMLTGPAITQCRSCCEMADAGQFICHRKVFELLKPLGLAGTWSSSGYFLIVDAPATANLSILSQPKENEKLRKKTDIQHSVDILKAFTPCAISGFMDATWFPEYHDQRQLSIISCRFGGGFRDDTMEDTKISALQSAYLTLEKIITNYEGIVHKFWAENDELVVLAAFGLPAPSKLQSTKSDSASAAGAALAIRKFLRLQGRKAKMGVAAGLITCVTIGNGQRRELCLIGDTIETARSLMMFCKEGDICCNDLVYFAAKSKLTFEELQSPLPMQHLEFPIPLYSLKKETASSLVSNRYRTKLIGLEKTLEYLAQSLDQLKAGHSPGVFIIRGETGVGKSRLLRELQTAATSRGLDLFTCTCTPQMVAPLSLWSSLLRDILCMPDMNGDEHCRDAIISMLGNCLTEDPLIGAAALAPYLGYISSDPAPNGSGNTSAASSMASLPNILEDAGGENGAMLSPHERARKYMTTLLQAVASVQPFVLTIDDAQNMDKESWELFTSLSTMNKALCCAATRRISGRGKGQIVDLAFLSPSIHVMDPIMWPIEEIGKIAAEIGQAHACSDIVSKFLFERTKGNPQFTLEWIDCLIAKNQTTITDEAVLKFATGAEYGTNPAIPPITEQSLLLQFEALSDMQQVVLKAAAIMGSFFEAEWLSWAVGEVLLLGQNVPSSAPERLAQVQSALTGLLSLGIIADATMEKYLRVGDIRQITNDGEEDATWYKFTSLIVQDLVIGTISESCQVALNVLFAKRYQSLCYFHSSLIVPLVHHLGQANRMISARRWFVEETNRDMATQYSTEAVKRLFGDPPLGDEGQHWLEVHNKLVPWLRGINKTLEAVKQNEEEAANEEKEEEEDIQTYPLSQQLWGLRQRVPGMPKRGMSYLQLPTGGSSSLGSTPNTTPKLMKRGMGIPDNISGGWNSDNTDTDSEKPERINEGDETPGSRRSGGGGGGGGFNINDDEIVGSRPSSRRASFSVSGSRRRSVQLDSPAIQLEAIAKLQQQQDDNISSIKVSLSEQNNSNITINSIRPKTAEGKVRTRPKSSGSIGCKTNFLDRLAQPKHKIKRPATTSGQRTNLGPVTSKLRKEHNYRALVDLYSAVPPQLEEMREELASIRSRPYVVQRPSSAWFPSLEMAKLRLEPSPNQYRSFLDSKIAETRIKIDQHENPNSIYPPVRPASAAAVMMTNQPVRIDMSDRDGGEVLVGDYEMFGEETSMVSGREHLEAVRHLDFSSTESKKSFRDITIRSGSLSTGDRKIVHRKRLSSADPIKKRLFWGGPASNLTSLDTPTKIPKEAPLSAEIPMSSTSVAFNSPPKKRSSGLLKRMPKEDVEEFGRTRKLDLFELDISPGKQECPTDPSPALRNSILFYNDTNNQSNKNRYNHRFQRRSDKGVRSAVDLLLAYADPSRRRYPECETKDYLQAVMSESSSRPWRLTRQKSKTKMESTETDDGEERKHQQHEEEEDVEEDHHHYQQQQVKVNNATPK